jgi:hypothetical protein
MASDDLVAVYSVSNPVEAEIIKNALEAEGIRCFIEGENQAGEAGLIALQIRLFVPANQAERAAKFIEEHERGERQHAQRQEQDEDREPPAPTDTGIEPHGY